MPAKITRAEKAAAVIDRLKTRSPRWELALVFKSRIWVSDMGEVWGEQIAPGGAPNE
jgi:hypothetical protein